MIAIAGWMEMEKLLVLLAELPSPPPLTVILTGTTPVRFGATSRFISIAGNPGPVPGFRLSERVQLAVLVVQFQPTAKKEFTLRPWGSVAPTVKGPDDGVLPEFLTSITIVPAFWPCGRVL